MVPSLLERIVPPGGNFQLMEYSLPPGTVVGTQAWSVHRDSEVFPSPETFDPDRWLDDKGSAVRAASMMPFGLGTRVCVGQALAQAALRIALAALVRNFAITADQSTTKASMTMRHGFVCLLEHFQLMCTDLGDFRLISRPVDSASCFSSVVLIKIP
jgi:hypothetical protein